MKKLILFLLLINTNFSQTAESKEKKEESSQLDVSSIIQGFTKNLSEDDSITFLIAVIVNLGHKLDKKEEYIKRLKSIKPISVKCCTELISTIYEESIKPVYDKSFLTEILSIQFIASMFFEKKS